jgi:hypothetical protein
MNTAILHVSASRRESPAIIDATGSYSYGRFDDDAWRVAARLRGQGRRTLAAARVAYFVSPGYQHAVVQEGIWRARCVGDCRRSFARR